MVKNHKKSPGKIMHDFSRFDNLSMCDLTEKKI